MGNCSTSLSTAEISPQSLLKPPAASAATSATSSAAVLLYGSPDNSSFLYIRYALHLKKVSSFVIPSPDPPLLRVGDDAVSGSRESLLRYLDEKFPHPKLVGVSTYRSEGSLKTLLLMEGEETAPAVVRAVVLQHRSVVWHLERMVRLVEDLRTRGSGEGRGGGWRRKKGGSSAVDLSWAKMEVRKLGEFYSTLLELMLEHAQMEERVVFPILEAANPGLCKIANEEHGRDLPIMNGIKEVIKSISVLYVGSHDYQEALSDLSTRLKSLHKRSVEHFEEEQRHVLPLMEAVELSNEDQLKVLERCFDMMQATHSRLFKSLMEGLLPWEAMLYLDLIIRCKDEQQAVLMLGMIVE